MRRMAARAGRYSGVFLLLEPLAMNRGVVFGNLIDPQRRIISPHEARVRVALAAGLDHLSRCGFADVALLPVHRLQAHDGGITAVTRCTAKALGGMDVRFVKLRRLGQILYAECQMTGRAGVFLSFCFRSGDTVAAPKR